MAPQPIPEGYHAVTPYLIVQQAAQAIAFYRRVFSAEEKFRMNEPDGRIGHAELFIRDSALMLADEYPELGILSPTTIGGAGVSLVLHVEDADRVYNAALDAGATVLRPIQNQFYGDRSGTVRDPFGHVWTISTHVEDVPTEEIRARATAFGKENESE
ncbi:MAG: VOC family protein [Candidatus Hydrogenedentes bacterium]|nr:VOC family protein [Candidatus Hydrogenedentota bacterium]